MDVVLKVTIRNTAESGISGALQMVEEIKASHPNLFQRIEVAIEC